MHNYSISEFFTKKSKNSSSNNNRDMNRKGNRGKPKLVRCNGIRHTDYVASPSSSSSSSSRSSDFTSALFTRSLELPDDKTSFRINGAEGEFDIVCRSIGLSAADFDIPPEAWATRNHRSNSDLLPLSRLDRLGSIVESSEPQNKEREDVSHLADKLDVLSAGGGVHIGNGVGAGVGGLKGDRPPVLRPPPYRFPPIIDHSCSTSDLIKSFGPDNDNSAPLSDYHSSSSDDEAQGLVGVISKREVVRGVMGEESAGPSDSCSLTTSNDDDSSSTTTDPTPNISPTGRFKRGITNWQKGRLLGRGTFGSVYEAIAEDGSLLAIKEVSLIEQGNLAKQSVDQLEQEIDLLSRFTHENIVQYYGTEKACSVVSDWTSTYTSTEKWKEGCLHNHVEDESNLYIFLELVKGSLVSLYQAYRLIDLQVSRYTIQILHGLKYLHAQNIVHRDIKCANILVDAYGVVKLADFGLAKATLFNDVKSCKGTPFWMAPEVVRGDKQGYGLSADIWSLGCTVLEMFTRQTPYSPMEPMPAMYRIGQGELPPLPNDLSPDAENFILQCLQKIPSSRPSASQLLDHPFVKRWAHLYTSTGSRT